jgi:hypothetical protein
MTWSSHSNWAIDLIRFDVGSCFGFGVGYDLFPQL